jgi:DtxR family Mn-dependent transcriptional regulator
MTQKKTRLSDSLEDYLEIILALEKSNKVARVKDIAGEMGVLRGSVSSALKKLGEKGLIKYEPYSFITLTPQGAAIAREISRRHEVIKDFLIYRLTLKKQKPTPAEWNMLWTRLLSTGLYYSLNIFIVAPK